jgi:predicted metal-dependent peptidase
MSLEQKGDIKPVIRPVQELQEMVKKAIASLIVVEPFIGIFSKMTNVYYVEDAPQVAWTDGNSIFLGSLINGMSPRDVAHVIAHEAMHIILKHAIRSKQILKRHPELLPEQFFQLANYVADAYVHMYLMHTKISPTSYENLVKPSDVKDAFGVSIEDKSFEETLELIIKSAKKIEVDKGGGCIGNHKRPKKTVLLNEGSHGDDDAEDDEEKIEREINKRLADAYNATKSTGTIPEGIERLVDELLKPKVNWRAIIRRDLYGFFGARHRYSWKKMSKKQPGLVPGRKSYGKGDALILIDTSGSIGEEELRQFVTEAFAIAKAAGRDVIVIPWDAEAYEPIKIRHSGDVMKVRLKGGGGTVIYPALKLAEKYVKPSTRIIILSDWDIDDIYNQNVRDWLYRYRGQIYAVTTMHTPPKFLQYSKISF